MPLFIKQGAIIPTQKVLNHTSEEAVSEIEIDVFPDSVQSSFQLYDDDGSSYDYESGEYFKQTVTAQDRGAAGIAVELSTKTGSYASDYQSYLFKLHGKAASQVTLGGAALTKYSDLAALRAASGEGYDAATDADTLCNLTNHSYFNLNGGGSVLSHMLLIHADSFLENDVGCLPTGKILNVEGTPFDFRQTKEVGRDIDANNVQIHNCGGYDHSFCLNDTDAGLRPVAQLSSAMTGITMRVATTMPGMQVYSANFLTERNGKNGQIYKKHDAICLETQFYPNAINCENFSKPILHAGESYHHVTTFSFSTGDKA